MAMESAVGVGYQNWMSFILSRAAGLAGLISVTMTMLLAGVVPANAAKGVACHVERPSTPDAALKALIDGNLRWANDAQEYQRQDKEHRKCVAEKGQTPFAAVLSCSDSRVPSELIFDQGVGDLFVVRNAGNSTDELVVQSLAYSVEVLGVEIVVVLGHQLCGAVTGAVEQYPKPAPLFLTKIYDAVKAAKGILGAKAENKDALVTDSIDQHAILEAKALEKTAPFDKFVQSGKLRIVAGRYDLDSGRVVFLGDAAR